MLDRQHIVRLCIFTSAAATCPSSHTYARCRIHTRRSHIRCHRVPPRLCPPECLPPARLKDLMLRKRLTLERIIHVCIEHTRSACMHSIGPMDVHIDLLSLSMTYSVIAGRPADTYLHHTRASALGGRPQIRTRAGLSGRRVEGIPIFRNDRWQPGGASGQAIWVLSSGDNLGGFGEHWWLPCVIWRGAGTHLWARNREDAGACPHFSKNTQGGQRMVSRYLASTYKRRE